MARWSQDESEADEVDDELNGGLDIGPAQAEHGGPVADPQLLADEQGEQVPAGQHLAQAPAEPLHDESVVDRRGHPLPSAAGSPRVRRQAGSPTTSGVAAR